MKKRIISIFLALTLIISIGTVTINADSLEDLQSKITKITDIDDTMLTSLLGEMKKSFKDTNQSSWYAKHVAKILGIKGINGYPDGTFKPNGTITRAEFTKILIAALYGDLTNEECATHWACAYVKKAEAIGILNKNEFTRDNIDKPITRQEIARMISLALQKSLSESITDNLSDVEKLIKDSNTFNTAFKNHILNAYSKGIITGYPDKTFGATKTATRAEASTMLVRVLDTREREELGTVKWETVVENGYTVPSQEYKVFGKLSLNNEEQIKRGYAEISMSLNIYSDYSLADQWLAAETALLSKFDAATVKKVMDHVKKKTDRKYILEDLEFTVGNKLFYAYSPGGNPLITIQVYNK